MRTLLLCVVALLADTYTQAQSIEVYKDKINGVSWSSGLSDKYSNGCTLKSNPKNKVECNGISAAASACLDLKARLPTVDEYNSLIENFDHYNSAGSPPLLLSLTSAGINDMKNVFKDSGRCYWISGPGPDGEAVVGYTFDYGYPSIGSDMRYSACTVRCVTGP